MWTLRRWFLTALAVGAGACGSSRQHPSLSLEPSVATFDGRTEHAVLVVRASAADGHDGTGTVSLVAGAGHFVDGAALTLTEGLATTVYRCDPSEEPACNGNVLLGATWNGVNASVQVRVTPSEAVTAVRWSALPTMTTAPLRAVAAGQGQRVWAVGDTGSVVSLGSSKWELVPSGTFADLLSVAFTAAGEALIVGRDATFLREHAGVLEVVPTGLKKDFTALWAGSQTDVVIGASDGTVYEFDGTAFNAVTTLSAPVLAIAAYEDRVYAGGEGSVAVRDHGAWSLVTLPMKVRVTIAAASPEGLWLGGPRLDATGAALLLGPTTWRFFSMDASLSALAIVPSSAERFAVGSGTIWRQVTQGGDFAAIDAPAGGAAAVSRGPGDLVVVGPPGLSLTRRP